MTYDIGSKSLIFKKVSMFLQDTYLNTLEVSDEYTLDLAKCIYEYLRDFYSNTNQYYYLLQDMPDDFTTNFNKYFIKTPAGLYTSLTSPQSFSENTYYTLGLDISIADTYVLGLQTGVYKDKSRNYNSNFPGILTYKLSGYTKDFSISEQNKNLLNIASAAERIYDTQYLIHILDILDDPETHNIEGTLAKEEALRTSGSAGELTDSEIRDLEDRLAYLHSVRAKLPAGPTSNSDSEAISQFIDCALKQVNKFNIASWPINETILQFLIPDVVITENSSEEDIAQMQLLAEALDYRDYTSGFLDETLSNLFREIQQLLMDQNNKVLIHGYCDTFTERYLRTKNEIRTEVY